VSALQLPPPPKPDCLRLVLVGDVVGKPGMRIVCDAVPWLRRAMSINVVIVNAENAADGSGLRCVDYRRLIERGVDIVTLGDHLYRKREIMEPLTNETNIIRPANLPERAPGRGSTVFTARDGILVGVTSLIGRVFMKPVDCPFHAADREISAFDPAVKIRMVDFHAEATSDKQLMGRYLDGRVSAVLGTHTHVATADEQILQGGTGFQCDVGMTGPFDSILGRNTSAVMEATLHGVPVPFQVAVGDVRLNGTWVDVNIGTGACEAIGRISVREDRIKSYNEQAKSRPLPL
jgi:2',3'-cyclic-nucleotide 2'-phosphodiesterase